MNSEQMSKKQASEHGQATKVGPCLPFASENSGRVVSGGLCPLALRRRPLALQCAAPLIAVDLVGCIAVISLKAVLVSQGRYGGIECNRVICD